MNKTKDILSQGEYFLEELNKWWQRTNQSPLLTDREKLLFYTGLTFGATFKKK